MFTKRRIATDQAYLFLFEPKHKPDYAKLIL